MESVAKSLTLRGVSSKDMLKSLAESSDLVTWLQSIQDPVWVAILQTNYGVLDRSEVRRVAHAVIVDHCNSQVSNDFKKLVDVLGDFIAGRSDDKILVAAWNEARLMHAKNSADGWRWNLSYALVAALDPWRPNIVPVVDQKGTTVRVWREILADNTARIVRILSK